jgi:folylpolyglutamate synthase/dihydropteroate synthase
MLKELKLIASKIIVTQSTHANAYNAVRLAKCTSPPQSASRLKTALTIWNKRGPLIVTGSLFLAAEALKLLDA